MAGANSRQFPKVSIGMPVYNGENYLGNAIESLLSQTYTDFELIISDNHSTDRTEEICRAYGTQDSRVRYHRAGKNHGLAWNFNRTVELAHGQFFTWKCHDDLCAPTWLERCVGLLDADREVVWAHSRCRYVDGQGEFIFDQNGPIEASYLPPQDRNSSQQRSIVSRSNSAPSKRYRAVLSSETGDFFALMRTDAIRRTRLHRPYYGGDQVFMAEISLLGRYAEVPEPLFYQRRHASQSQWTRTARQQHELTTGRPAPWLLMPRRITRVLGRLGAISRSPICLSEKLRCYLATLSFVLNEQRWRRIGVDALRGMGFEISVPEDVIDPRRLGEADLRTSHQFARVQE